MVGAKRVERYDVVIIGGGASGLTTSIYCARAMLKTLVIEQSLVGGMATNTDSIENYPGFPQGISGTDLMNLFYAQAKKFGVKFKLTDVKNVNIKGDRKIVETFREKFEAKTVILCNGSIPKLTYGKNEQQFLGRGIAFCATCDAKANTGKKVVVIGSGDAAIEEGIFLTKFASKVTVSVIHDKGTMDCNEIAKTAALANPKMEFLHNTIVEGFKGKEKLNQVILKDLKTDKLIPVDCSTCFLFIGYTPNTEIYKDKIKMNQNGYIVTDEKMQTNILGVFAAGDVREKPLRQVATCVGDAAIAAVMAEKYIAESVIYDEQIMKGNKIVYVYNATNAKQREFIKDIDELSSKHKNYSALKIDTYKSDGIAKRLNVKSPAVILIENGMIRKTFNHDIRKEVIKNYLF